MADKKKKYLPWQEIIDLLTNEVEVTHEIMAGVHLVVNINVTKWKYNKLLRLPPICYCDTENKTTYTTNVNFKKKNGKKILEQICGENSLPTQTFLTEVNLREDENFSWILLRKWKTVSRFWTFQLTITENQKLVKGVTKYKGN